MYLIISVRFKKYQIFFISRKDKVKHLHIYIVTGGNTYC